MMRDIKGGYWYALTRKIPVSKTHYICALNMTIVGHSAIMAITSAVRGWWPEAAVSLLLLWWFARPRPYKRTPITRDTFLS